MIIGKNQSIHKNYLTISKKQYQKYKNERNIFKPPGNFLLIILTVTVCTNNPEKMGNYINNILNSEVDQPHSMSLSPNDKGGKGERAWERG